MNGYRIAERARSDLQEIARYTRMRWGSRQLKTYMRQLASRFVWLAENPQFGKRRPDIGPMIQSFPEGEHIIFYRSSTGGIEIVAVVHIHGCERPQFALIASLNTPHQSVP